MHLQDFLFLFLLQISFLWLPYFSRRASNKQKESWIISNILAMLDNMRSQLYQLEIVCLILYFENFENLNCGTLFFVNFESLIFLNLLELRNIWEYLIPILFYRIILNFWRFRIWNSGILKHSHIAPHSHIDT